MAGQFGKSQSAMVKVRLRNKIHLAIHGVPIYYRPAGYILEVPEQHAEVMIRNGSAEVATDPLLPHLFAKKTPSI